MIISLNAEEVFDKNSTPLEITRIQGTYLNIIKTIYSKLTANIKLNGKKLKVTSLKSETNKAVLSLHMYSIKYL